MKKLSLLFCLLALSTALYSQETQEHTRVIIGERAHSEEVLLAQEKARTETITRLSKEPDSIETQEQAAKRAVANNLYYTLHPGAFHQVALVSIGDLIGLETEDGAIWTIAPEDAGIVLNWFAADSFGFYLPTVVISLNHEWFSLSHYRLTNQDTGQSITANLYLGPNFKGPRTHWIVAIDYYYNVVYLEDGSVWNMSHFDDGVVNNWFEGDTVIILVNDGWLSSANPNLLLNVNTLTQAAGAANF